MQSGENHDATSSETSRSTSVIRSLLGRAKATTSAHAIELDEQVDAILVEHRELIAERNRIARERDAAAEERDRVKAENDKLKHVYDILREQLELMRRRIYQAKAERIDVTQLVFEFGETKKRLDEIESEAAAASEFLDNEEPKPEPNGGRPKPKGRRDMRNVKVIREDRMELRDEETDKLVAEGKAKFLKFEESFKFGWQVGGPVRVVIARAKYGIVDESTGAMTIETTAVPRELFRRSLLAPSMLAHLLVAKYSTGIPFYRLEALFAHQGLDLSRGMMCRYAEDAGATLGAIVDVCAADAKANAFCLATDATGVAIQPTPLADKSRQACRKGHFFVVMADKDHVFFEYTPRHTSEAVCTMFRGYSGYIQADAHAIYDALFRGSAVDDPNHAPKEVACWSHARRNFWEAAVQKHPLAREALLRIRAIFQRDARMHKWTPDKRKRYRDAMVRPLVDDFFAWAEKQFDAMPKDRGSVAKAFGYAMRHREALCRFLDDPRLEMTNNRSERALRSPIAIGRKAWLFCGSDDHASAAANLFSLIASCRLHKLDPEAYLRDVIRVMPYWPRERYIELAPIRWAATRARLDATALAREVGPIAIPDPLLDAP